MLQDSSSLAGEFNPFTPEGTPLRVKEETESHALTGKGGGRGRRVGGGGGPFAVSPTKFRNNFACQKPFCHPKNDASVPRTKPCNASFRYPTGC